MHQWYLFFSEAVVWWPPPTSFMCSRYSCDSATYDWRPSQNRGNLVGRFSHYHYANLFYRYQQYVVSHNLWWERDIKGWMHFFGQAPQLAEILRIIIRYNLLTTLFGPTRAMCFLGGGGVYSFSF